MRNKSRCIDCITLPLLVSLPLSLITLFNYARERPAHPLFARKYTRCSFVMAVIRFMDTEPPLRTMSPESLFYGLFFGLGGGILFLVIFVGLIYWRCARSGRIRLGSGAPGELDDEQRLLEEERAAMEQLDPNQQDAYYRAKGTQTPLTLSVSFN